MTEREVIRYALRQQFAQTSFEARSNYGKLYFVLKNSSATNSRMSYLSVLRDSNEGETVCRISACKWRMYSMENNNAK